MKFRMAENSLFAVLLRQRWWVSAGIALGMGLAAMAVLPRDWRLVGAFSGFPFMVIAVLAAWRHRHAPSPGRIEEVNSVLRSLPWAAFADLLEQAFQRDGHTVRRLTGGADFELSRRGQVLLVSARRWKMARIGVEPLRELQTARESAGAGALFIGLGELSEPAVALAAQQRIAFWGAAELAQSLRGMDLPKPRPSSNAA